MPPLPLVTPLHFPYPSADIFFLPWNRLAAVELDQSDDTEQRRVVSWKRFVHRNSSKVPPFLEDRLVDFYFGKFRILGFLDRM